MRYQELLLILVMMSAGTAVAPRDSQAYAEAIPHHYGAASSVARGYTRSVASYKMPNVKLVDENGTKISLHDSLDGPTPVMLNFFSASCSKDCPVMSATLPEVQKRLEREGAGVRMVSISVDPERDSPAMLKKYAAGFATGPQWSMLTGSSENSLAIQRAFHVYHGDKVSRVPVTFLHPGRGKPWVRIDGFISADDLLNEYRKLVSN